MANTKIILINWNLYVYFNVFNSYMGLYENPHSSEELYWENYKKNKDFSHSK